RGGTVPRAKRRTGERNLVSWRPRRVIKTGRMMPAQAYGSLTVWDRQKRQGRDEPGLVDRMVVSDRTVADVVFRYCANSGVISLHSAASKGTSDRYMTS